MPSTPTDRLRTRQRVHRPPPTLTVPDIDEDAAGRKRVLNVLAQRRYRQRKREARLGTQGPHEGPAQSQSPEEPRHAISPHPGDGISTTEAATGDVVDFPFLSPENLSLPIQSPNAATRSFDVGQRDEMPLQWPTYSPEDADCQPDVSTSLPFAFTNEVQPLSLVLLSGTSNTLSSSNPSTYTSSPAQITIHSGYPPNDSGTSPPNHNITNSSTATESFADSYYLSVPPLTLLRALVRIATRLKAMPFVWSLTAASPFNIGTGPDPSQLPLAWHPTSTQITVPHHPVLDLLPWPGVRDRMIGYLSLGDGDGDSNGNDIGEGGSSADSGTGSRLVDFIYDMEDGAEGIRIWGADPYDEANWEVGQVVFERWWFVFDKRVVAMSNRWRRQRGAEPLRVAGAQ
ncbi:BZIP domain-containing protein [Madurella fahalii]|uniref:BZIP domain-containing protein n=1 Tax=Madurella fahalii TaxID=1157608 RepID=A0ABQ0GJR1_9PEZI